MLAFTTSGATASLPGKSVERRRSLETGEKISRYVILQHVGSGAMGAVYKAYDPSLERPVALKLLHEGGTAETRDRMLREAQALAKLSHPNVIAVYDVGAVGEDVYLAMDFVEGKPIDAWLKSEPRPSQAAILRAFLEAGDGLAAAHAAGLIHRDFKPANVLFGDDGRVRVIDFGLARGALAGPELPSGEARVPAITPSSSGLVHATLTQPGFLAGTPRYMAPEQRKLKALSPAADQYAFCVSIWESLAGSHPFADEQGIFRPGSSALRGDTTLPRPVRRALERGLSQDPADRWPTLDGLVRELRRDPYVGRRRVAYGAAFAAVGMAFFALTHGRGDVRTEPCGGGAARLTGVWDAQVASAISASFVGTGWPGANDEMDRVRTGLDAYTSRWVAETHDACVAARVDKTQSERVFDLRSQCLERRLGEVRAATDLLREANRETATHASTLVGALGDPGACSAARVNEHAQALPQDVNVRTRIARVQNEIDRALVVAEAGRLRDARAALASAALEAREVAYEPLLAEALVRVGEVAAKDGDGAAALASLDEGALRAGRAGEDRVFAEALLARAELLSGSVGRPASTLDLEPALAGAVARAGVAPDLQSRLQTDLARTYDELGRYDEALVHAREGLRISEASFGKYTSATALSLRRLASIERLAGARDEAKADSAEAVARLTKILGSDHPELFDALLDQASAESSGGDVHVAEALVRRAIHLLDGALPGHPRLADAYRRLGSNLLLQGRSREAEEALETAATLALKATPPNYVVLGDIYGWLGDVVRELRGVEAARVPYSKVRDAYRASGRMMDPFLGDTLSLWASAECEAGHAREAESIFSEARVVLGAREDFWRVKLLTTEAECMVSSHRPRQAVERAREAIARLQGMKRNADLADAHFVLARALWDLGDRGGSLAQGRQASAALAGTGRARAQEIDTWVASRAGRGRAAR